MFRQTRSPIELDAFEPVSDCEPENLIRNSAKQVEKGTPDDQPQFWHRRRRLPNPKIILPSLEELDAGSVARVPLVHAAGSS